MNAKQILLDAAALVEKYPKTWTKGASAKNSNDEFVHPDDPEAVCWCAIGFIPKVSSDSDPDAYNARAARQALRSLTEGSISNHNDNVIKTPTEFVSWFREAAALCE